MEGGGGERAQREEGEERQKGGWGDRERETVRERRVGRERCLEGKGQGIRGKL